ncbi:MAG: DUF4383 domain-containing protein [Burkholderiales bacterium]
MTARNFAAVCGALYLSLGLMGFVPALWERPPSAPLLIIRVFHGSLFGLFVVNIVLSMIHVVIGLWAAMAANNRYSALTFTQVAAGIFGALGVAGLMPIAPVKTAYGTLPLYGYNAWLHLATAAVALYFAIRPGYRLRHIDIRQTINPHRTSA